MSLSLLPLKETYAVWQPPQDCAVDADRFKTCEFFTLCYTADEVSVVCPVANLPDDAPGALEKPWRGFRVAGQLDFALVGILAQISGVLAEHKISLFAISTFDTDYILVKENDFANATKVLGETFVVGE